MNTKGKSTNTDSDRNITTYGFLPLLIIIILVIIWGIGAILWAMLFIVNIMTTAIGGFVFVLIDGPFILVDAILVWIWHVVINYFTRDSWFNWLNNLYLLIILFTVNEVQLIIERKSFRGSYSFSKLKSSITRKFNGLADSQSTATIWNVGDIIHTKDLEKGMTVLLNNPYSKVKIVLIEKSGNIFEISYKTSSGSLRSDFYKGRDEFEFIS
ncbi:MAG: hypothetical protein GPJ54_22420 [Candidatus Heimdallarchaeota archaeon]|nr:hypothetical protein [Candidatus Heimdallarchaeota archaeon]